MAEVAKARIAVSLTPITSISGLTESADHDVIAKDIQKSLGAAFSITGAFANWTGWDAGSPTEVTTNATIPSTDDVAWIRNKPDSSGNVTVRVTDSLGAILAVLQPGEAVVLPMHAGTAAIYFSCAASTTAQYTSMT